MMNIIVFIAGFRDMYHDVYVHMDSVKKMIQQKGLTDIK